ncbi:hypothetical protein ACH4FX_35765 [Streptomyces sp. NPDC018019]|uniref:hypothetical protein n=1 Tax=Streptomyces sp. NPDC018019 TaxID=3365030 RepID=UPI00379580F9
MEDEQRRSAGWGTTAGLGKPSPYTVMVSACLLLSAVAGWSGLVLVVAGQVVPGWLVGSALLLVLLVIVGVRAVRRRVAGGEAAKRRSVPACLVLALLGGAAGLGSALGAVGDVLGGAEYRVLEPHGPGGCRAVTRETSFLMAGGGEVYAVGGSGIGRRESSWTADDGLRPIAEGLYRLRWGVGGGSLVVSGRVTDPVRPALHGVACD